ncbi:TMEM175 family protein [Novosphingobium mangrovi (ex Huang et al. 2023)]|uniref:TMEM175 family protein n=1 Tax=Novosphingobium mangrovi (ex Huang et al. 2023) TaxID=2976432 RepID=A0ABT2I1Q9_9SPHN|nr:TMEM175 family protein [Novosphingobium mangrovi (ex Huang et al. 2023)]MCT2398741.1 TMEM175 family protein [Novosphingobium mangrovi (ex Huang et al. 2023)]
MRTNRLEAFSDGVLAIIITIMVLELKVPHGNAQPSALLALWPIFSSYVLSFIYIGIYWNNHHHMLQATKRVTGGVLWANLHLLFWLSLLPFTTGWMGENEFGVWPTALYGLNLLCCAIAYFVLERAIIAVDGRNSVLARAIGLDMKGKLSPLLYLLGIGSALLVTPWLGIAFFAGVAAMWLVPDRRIEQTLAGEGHDDD